VGSPLDRLEVPAELWQRAEVRCALETRDFGLLFRLVRKYVRGSQTQIGIAVGLTQATVSQVMSGRRQVTGLDVIERIADGLAMPDTARLALGLAPIARPPQDVAESLSLPMVRLDDLSRIVAARNEAPRRLDSVAIEDLRQQLLACTVEDGTHGARRVLPVVLGIVGIVSDRTRDLTTGVRRELLALGARGAEFVGWLYRDVGAADLAGYWRDRAMEWAQTAGDHAMRGYILLKTSQLAWDQRDAIRMLTLAQAVQDGPWRLSSRIRAEAVLQEARAHAMLRAGLDRVERKLNEAREMMTDDGSPAAEPGSYHSGRLLAMQTAICYHQAGLPERAVEVYERELTPARFSRRDYGYFLSLKSAALVSVHQPDQAALAGLHSHAAATATRSVRTLRELDRVANGLRPWVSRASVREFRRAMLAD
jgi:transcriptional regulator with XRE-family HTH domain